MDYGRGRCSSHTYLCQFDGVLSSISGFLNRSRDRSRAVAVMGTLLLFLNRVAAPTSRSVPFAHYPISHLEFQVHRYFFKDNTSTQTSPHRHLRQKQNICNVSFTALRSFVVSKLPHDLGTVHTCCHLLTLWNIV